MPDLAGGADIRSGVVVDRHRQMEATFVILFDGDDRCNLSAKNDVKGIGAAARLQADAIAVAQLRVTNLDGFDSSRGPHRPVQAHELFAVRRRERIWTCKPRPCG